MIRARHGPPRPWLVCQGRPQRAACARGNALRAQHLLRSALAAAAPRLPALIAGLSRWPPRPASGRLQDHLQRSLAPHRQPCQRLGHGLSRFPPQHHDRQRRVVGRRCSGAFPVRMRLASSLNVVSRQ